MSMSQACKPVKHKLSSQWTHSKITGNPTVCEERSNPNVTKAGNFAFQSL